MRPFIIAIAHCRQARIWKNTEMTFEELKTRLKSPVKTGETMAEYVRMDRADRDRVKDQGGFVGGSLKDGRRKIESVEFRSMLTLDGDRITAAFLETYEKNMRYASVLYATHSSTPEKPRARILIPLTRDVTPEEFAAVSRYIAQGLDMDCFDECSYLPNQMMYWPSIPTDGNYIYKETTGPWLNPDEILAAHPDWKDPTTLPISSRETTAKAFAGKKAQDPLTKDGVIGLFNRTYYPIQKALDTFLPDIYELTDSDQRYHLIGSSSMAGVEIKEDKFVYSHHATDAAYLQLCNAFDIVRIHLFGDLEEKESVRQMIGFALSLDAVKKRTAEEKLKAAQEDFKEADEADETDAAFDADDNAWWVRLTYNPKNGKIENTLQNIQLILENDPQLKNIIFNELADGLEIKGPVPWSPPSNFWRDQDDAQLISYIDSHYGTFNARNYEIAVTKVADDRRYHPIRDMLESLPPWDGVSRADTLLIDYLGAPDNAYVRAVTRKTLCAAYRRVYKPGIKFDYMLVLTGPQGIGKSTLIKLLGQDWFSDSLSLYDMNDKTAAEKLQGFWIHEISELNGMKKADLDKMKAFISRQDDQFRAAFGRRVTHHPRQCIFIGTTNTDTGYLRDITGNRRFWNVSVTGKGSRKPWELDELTIQMIWAEVVALAKAGETLYLPAELEAYAEGEQIAAMEEDEREGIVAEYLDMLLPDNWDRMDLYHRREYWRNQNDPISPRGNKRRETVCTLEIWCECFGNDPKDFHNQDSFAMRSIMIKMAGWEKTDDRPKLPIYGRQRIFVRKPE